MNDTQRLVLTVACFVLAAVLVWIVGEGKGWYFSDYRAPQILLGVVMPAALATTGLLIHFGKRK